jgi:hypothetical protein
LPSAVAAAAIQLHVSRVPPSCLVQVRVLGARRVPEPARPDDGHAQIARVRLEDLAHGEAELAAAQRAGLGRVVIGSIFLQDQAATESMGPVYDRSQERLGSSDMMVIRTRKRLIDAAKSLRAREQVPPGVNNPGVYAVRSGGVVLPRGANWLEATAELRKAWAKHPDLTRDVLGGVPAV